MANQLILSNNLRKIRAQARTLSTERLESLLEKLQIVVSERHAEEEKAQQAIAEHNKKVEKYLSMMQSEGINLSDLISTPVFKKIRNTRAPRPAKYKYTDDLGQQRTWTGQGRMPKVIRLAIEKQQNSLEDFLI